MCCMGRIPMPHRHLACRNRTLQVTAREGRKGEPGSRSSQTAPTALDPSSWPAIAGARRDRAPRWRGMPPLGVPPAAAWRSTLARRRRPAPTLSDPPLSPANRRPARLRCRRDGPAGQATAPGAAVLPLRPGAEAGFSLLILGQDASCRARSCASSIVPTM